MGDVILNHWRTLTYHDPAEKLRRLRAIEREVAEQIRGVELDPGARDVLALRTSELKKYREWRDAAIFTYGMGLAQGVKMGFATEEAADYDFVTAWVEGDVTHYCPVQLKELVPADRNTKATIDGLLRGLRRYSGETRTVLAIRLNRRGRMILDREWPRIPFGQLWFFWASAPDASQWSIYGDALGEPGQWAFDYPS